MKFYRFLISLISLSLRCCWVPTWASCVKLPKRWVMLMDCQFYEILVLIDIENFSQSQLLDRASFKSKHFFGAYIDPNMTRWITLIEIVFHIQWPIRYKQSLTIHCKLHKNTMKVTRILQGSFFFPHNFLLFFFTIFFHKCLYVEIPQIFLFLLMYRKCKKMDGCYLNIIKKEEKN